MFTSRNHLTSRLLKRFVSIDQYGEPIQFSLNGYTRFPSVCGAILTLIASIIVLSYGVNKSIALINFTDSNYMSKIEDDAVDKTEKFDWNQTRLNVMVYATQKNGKKINIMSVKEYITFHAFDLTFDVENKLFNWEEVPYGVCNLQEIEEKMGS